MPRISRVSRTDNLSDIANFLNRYAPTHLAEEWDNVGLLTGAGTEKIRRIMLAIDLSPAVAQEVIAARADLLISYHPPIFKAQKTFKFDRNDPPSLAAKLAARGVWVYSPHTALDVAPKVGTNDVLAELLGATVTGSWAYAKGTGDYLKLVTFIPERDVEKVAEALFAAGCGHIGVNAKYDRCSFRSAGTGTFRGDDESNPAVGQRGVYEHQPEIRFETVLPATLAGAAVAALRASHPYEEPAFDLLPMAAPPENVGLGRIAELPRDMSLKNLAQLACQKLNIPAAQIVGQKKSLVRKIGVLAGSVGRLALELPPATRKKFDVLITGELKHHDALAYQAAGIPVICLGHSHSERPALKVLMRALAAKFTNVHVSLSRQDADPFTFISR